ncbi:efflux RND transporter periplasmic adaptor subunit [Alkalimonas collagenimarina]|uniref:Efflux RND transporter periplasmic adaptor subunit n=1 Tax=Alkalimonas collagenimarina TaxID=400390 RepID=A0ABT9GWD3_9GAMM|nr:efflux RND transporter periplasmic adaptor subunit [Alkalimonas collagenimarina]MDP4535366.1 efflux RND transporter periplasmic adaptor subunit [Alkalimonas collagenimarina]
MRLFSFGAALLAAQLLLATSSVVAHSKVSVEQDHQQQPHELRLSPQQQQLAGILVEPVALSGFWPQQLATATLIADPERSQRITAPMELQLLKRHVRPGQWVDAGQPLLTLGGIQLANAQAEFLDAISQWQRLAELTTESISASEQLSARVRASQARARLEALQMTPAQIALLQQQPEQLGRFELKAPQSGMVTHLQAVPGEQISPGSILLGLLDESSVWLQAELTSDQSEQLIQQTRLRVRHGQQWAEAELIGRNHQLDEHSRTEHWFARLDNRMLHWHPGTFVEVVLSAEAVSGVLVPDTALSRSADGHWQLFVQEGEAFVPYEVELVRSEHGWHLVQGITPGQLLVQQGAFFLASELLKAGFDPHQH